MRPISFELRSNYNYANGAGKYNSFPVRISIPSPAGSSSSDERLRLVDDAGKAVTASFAPLCRWPDGSVRVWSLWFAANLNKGESRRYTVSPVASQSQPGDEFSALAPPAIHKYQLSITTLGETLRQTVEFAPEEDAGTSPRQFEQERRFQLKDDAGRVVFHGALIRRSCNWYPGCEISTRIIQASEHDTLEVESVVLEFDLPGSTARRYAIKQSCIMVDHPRLVESERPFEIVADAAGVHVTDASQLHDVEENYPHYERGAYLCQVNNWVAMVDDDAGWLLVVPEAHERFPKAWRIEDHHVTIDLHPPFADPLQWRQGMALFQTFQIARLPASTTAAEFENEAWCRLRPPITQLDADLYRRAGWKVPFPYDPGRFPKTEMDIQQRFGFSWPHGTFDWGDDLSPSGVGRNLEYDFVAVAARENVRTGKPAVGKLLRSSAEHMMYTDFVDVSSDPWREGGIPAHCKAHTTGSAYPSHMWAEGLTLYYMLSGDPYALQVACRVADFFLKYIRERFEVIQGTAREFGWTLIALAGVYDVTRQEEYLDGIRKVVDSALDQPLEQFFPVDAVFTLSVAIMGLERTRHFHRDEETRRFILALLDHMMETRRDGVGNYEYWYDAEAGPIEYLQSYLPEALNIGYRLSGDQKYIRSALRQYQMAQGGVPLTVQPLSGPAECGYAAGYHITWLGCFQTFAELGWLDRLQYPDITG